MICSQRPGLPLTWSFGGGGRCFIPSIVEVGFTHQIDAGLEVVFCSQPVATSTGWDFCKRVVDKAVRQTMYVHRIEMVSRDSCRPKREDRSHRRVCTRRDELSCEEDSKCER